MMSDVASASPRVRWLPLSEALLVTVLGLIVFGLTMVYSSSAVFAANRYHDDTFFLAHQVMYAAAGVSLMFAVREMPLHVLRKHLRWILLVGLVALVLVLIPGIGRVVGGARRWISLGVFAVQPAEFAKIMTIAFMAHSVARRAEGKTETSLWVAAGWAQAFVLLVLFERDFGTAVILELSIITLLYLGGAPLKALFFAGVMLIPVAAFLIRSQPYRLARVKAFLDPFADRRGAGYQLGEALITIGSGGIFGVGLGDGRQKLFFLPEAHTDFIFAIIGEELGFVGICLLVLLFAAYLLVSFAIARKQTDPFARYFVFGLAAWVVMQAATNMAVATGLLPTKGLTLPFISSGGSSLLICCLATGLIMSAAREVEAV